jgi:hypothetical protein
MIVKKKQNRSNWDGLTFLSQCANACPTPACNAVALLAGLAGCSNLFCINKKGRFPFGAYLVFETALALITRP